MKQKTVVILDSTQISEFLACPRLSYYGRVKNLIPLRDTEDREAMNAGTYGHHLLERYYIKVAEGCSFNDAITFAFAFNPDTEVCECGCSNVQHKHLPALGLEECHQCNKCLHFRPKPFELSSSLRTQVLTRVNEYFMLHKYAQDDFKPYNPRSVEVGFSEVIYEDANFIFILEGRIDLLCTLQGLPIIVDHKFQLRSHDLYTKSIQFKNYSLVTKSVMLIVNYVRLAKTIPKEGIEALLKRVMVTFTVAELLAWKKQLIDIYFEYVKCKETGQWQQRYNNCEGKFGRLCKFTTLCEEPDNEMREMQVNGLYMINPAPWRPW